MRDKIGKIIIVLMVILATKIVFNRMDGKLVENCGAKGGYYQSEGIGEGCYGVNER